MKWHFMKSPSPLNFSRPSLRGRNSLRVRDVLLHEFVHLLFDFGEVFGRERSGAVEVVEESTLGRGTVAELGLRKSSRTAAASRCADEWRKLPELRDRCSVRMRTSESFSMGRFRSTRRGSVPFDDGFTCAASAAEARRGEMEFATSSAVAPLGNSFSEPSGNLILMVSGMEREHR